MTIFYLENLRIEIMYLYILYLRLKLITECFYLFRQHKFMI